MNRAPGSCKPGGQGGYGDNGTTHPTVHSPTPCVACAAWAAPEFRGSNPTRTNFFANVILTFTFAICYRPSVCRLFVVCRLTVTLVRPTQPV